MGFARESARFAAAASPCSALAAAAGACGSGGQEAGRVVRLSSWTARAADRTETWGAFGATLEVQGYAGPAILRVGGESARDGSSEGVTFPITLRVG